MLSQTAGESVCYAGELLVPEPLDAVRRHLPFYDSQWQFSAPNFAPIGPAPISVHMSLRPDGAAVAEY